MTLAIKIIGCMAAVMIMFVAIGIAGAIKAIKNAEKEQED